MTHSYAALMPITPRPDTVFVQGTGSWLTDSKGQQYLDFIQGWAVNTLGHCPPVIQEALQTQGGRLLNASPAFYNQPMLDCAQWLTEHSVFDQVFFINSGSEANEGAIKLARKWGQLHKQGAYKIITFQHSFHGRTLTTMAASGKAAFAPLFEPKTPGFIHVPFNDVEAVRAAIDDDTVAIMLEPIQGEGGVIPAELEFMQDVRALADEQQLLLVFDEVQTGIGRTGTLFAYQQYGVEPDIMTLAKGLGGGVPIAALLAKQAYCVFAAGEQGGTYGGNPLMAAVAQAVLQSVLSADFLPSVRARSVQLEQGLTDLSRQFGLGAVRGKGLLLALDTADVDAQVVVQHCFTHGLLLNAPRPDTLRFVPALNVSAAEVDEMLIRLAWVLSELG